MKNSTILSSAKPTFSSAKLIVNCPLSIVNYPLSIVTALLILFCLLFGGKVWAQTYTADQAGIIGTGTSGISYAPIDLYYKSFVTQMIYTADEIGLEGKTATIKTISFQFNHTTSVTSNSFTLYLGNTTKSSFSSTTDWVTASNMTNMGSYTITTGSTAGAWVTITLSSTFSYTGGNLVVCLFDNNQDSYPGTGSSTWRYTTTTNNRMMYYHTDSGTAPTITSSTTGTLSTYLPNIKLNIGGTSVTTCSGTLYDSGGSSGNYNIYEDYIYTFYPATSGNNVTIDLTSFASEASYDYFRVYDGTSTSATQLLNYAGQSLPSTTHYEATNQEGALTVWWHSDVSQNYAGFAATISCVAGCTSRTLSFSTAPTSVALGSTVTCAATPSVGSGTVTYSSLNTDIATVNASTGEITGVSLGNATIVATVTANGSYCSATKTYTISVVAPTPVVTQQNTNPLPQCGMANAILTASVSGGSVPLGYAFYWYSNSACTTEITEGVSGTNNNTLTYPATDGTNIYCRLEKRVAGTETPSQTFTYNGGVQTYTVPEGATSLQLEVWGAQGGSYSSSYSGGLGGYSKGTLESPTAGSTLYVVVGQQPSSYTSTPSSSTNTTIPGGYNGGGSSVVHYYKNSDSQYGWSLPQGGGGATHIATVSGVLSSLSSQQDNVLIVAGGGSGGVYCYGTGDVGLSGYTGFSGYAGGGSTSSAYSSTYQATQSAAGSNGSFGQGGSHTGGYNWRYGPAGGGGGWYGGGCNSSHSDTYSVELVHGHGGGSGYIKSTLTSTSSSNVSRSGHGQAKITATIPVVNVEGYSSAANFSIQCHSCDNPSGTFAINGSSTPSLGTDQTVTLNVSNTTGYTIEWESENTSVVTVAGSGNSADITGHNLGTATITASITPSNPDYCPMQLTYTVIVNPTITFDISTNCSGTASGQPAPQTVSVGTNVTVPWGGITCSDGKTFVGWNASSDGTGHAYREGDQVQVMQNTTLYAIFMPDPCDNIVDMQVGVNYEGILGDMGLWDSHNATCTWDEPGEERVYSFTPYKTGTHIFTFSTTDGDPDFYISTSCSNTIATLYCADADPDEQHEMELTRGITYYVIVDNAEDEISAGYLIRVDVLDPSGGVDSPCGTTIIYCSTSGNDGNDGGSTSPVRTLAQALTLANSVSPTTDNPAIIRMASGTYDVNAPVNLFSNIIIDGQWTANTTTGAWTKGTAATIINRTATNPEGGTTMPRITAIEGSSKSNFKLQDIKVTTSTAPAYSSISGNNYGVSTYAVHLNSCSGYEIIRCKLEPGAASAGNVGLSGMPGCNGSSGSAGTQGSTAAGTDAPGTRTLSSKSGGGGGYGCVSGRGGSGGSGGSQTNSTPYSGSAGTAGSAAGGTGGTAGTAGGAASDNDSPCYVYSTAGGAGGAGGVGSAGTTGSAYSISNSTDYGEYFIPKQAGTGGDGTAGGCGGGGGGGGTAFAKDYGAALNKNDVWAIACGGSGGGGGGGGGGGTGGTGGYGGGSSFGLYLYNTTLVEPVDTYIVSGSGGNGGSGGAGGSGGSGGAGGAGGAASSASKSGDGLHSGYAYAYGRTGGSGGRGGSGGAGGRGGSGATGVSYRIAVVGASGLTSSATSGYGTAPNTAITSIDYGSSSKQGCTNSQISLSKSSGSWASGQYGTLINDKNSTTSSYSTSSDDIITGYGSTGTYRPVSNGPQIFITQSRSLGVISGEDAFCNGATAEYTYDGDYISQGDVLQWRLVSSDGNTLYYAHAEMAASNGDESGTKFIINTESLNLAAGIYYVKLEVKSECCGVSIPIWKQITINDTPTGVIALSGTSPVCYNGSTTVSLTFTGNAPFVYELSNGTSGGPTYDNPATVTLSSITADNTYTITSLTDNTGCSAIASDLTGSATVTVLPVMSADITAPISGICIGTTTALTVSNITGVGPYSYQWQKSPNGTDSWSDITGANLATYNAPINEAGHTYYRVNITDNGNTSDCNTLTKNTDVNVLPALSAAEVVGGGDFCIGTTTSLTETPTSGSGSYNIVWKRGSTVLQTNNGVTSSTYSADISSAGNTTYTVVVTDANCGTSQTKTVDVNVWSALSAAEVVGGGDFCIGTTTSLTETPTSGSGSYNIVWKRGSTVLQTNNGVTSSTYSADISSAGNTTYTVVVTDANCGTSQTKTVDVNVWPALSAAEVVGGGDFCIGTTTSLTETPTSGSGNYNIVWKRGSTVLQTNNGVTSSTYSASIASAGNTTYTVVVTDVNCGTSQTKTVDVNVYPAFTAGAIASTGEAICKDATPTEIGSTTAASGGNGDIHYQWYVGSTAIDGATSETYTPTAYAATAGTYIFTRKANDGECNTTLTASTGSWTLTVEEASVGTVTASASPSTICIGSSATLSVSTTGNSGAMSYVWEGGSASVTPNVTTTYNVTATATTAGAGCTAETIKEVTVTVTAPSVDGIASGDMVWSGNAGTTNWATAGNWLTYGGSNYSVAASAPSASTNVFLATYGECVTSNPALTAESATRNLTIGSGRTLSLGSYTLSVAGNLTNNGTFNANTGTVVFNGSTHQTISGSSLSLNNVTFNNDKNFTLDGLTPTVTGLARFSAGVVTGDMNFGTSATTADASRASYVEGKVTKAAGASAFTFPTGNAGVLGSVTAIPTADTWVRFHNLVASGDALPADYPRFWNPNDNCDNNDPQFDHVSNFEYWDISSPAGLSNATIVASADNASKHFGSTDPAPTAEDVLGAIWTGGCWKNLGGSNQDISDENRTIRVEGVVIPAVTRAGTPYFTLGSKTHETLLPIELTSFTATCDGRSSLVEWTTATEKNNDYFSLERSDDAVNFTEIARVAGAGNSIEPIDYSYTDYGIHGGDNYYRLVQVDYDGTRTVSEIVVANCIDPKVGEPDVQAYPNPFSSDLTVVLDNFGNRAATIEVYDMLGKLVFMQKADAPQNSYQTVLNLSNLPSAAYTVRVSTNDFVINKNVVKN